MRAMPIRPRPFGAASAALCVARLQDIPVAAARELLSATELERARGITHHEAWLQFVLTRGLLRLVLAHCTGRPPRSFAIAEDGGAAPRLVDNPWGLHFNVSHSHDWAAVAVGSVPLGVDIERVDADCGCETIAEICFHAEERERLRQTPRTRRVAAFFEIWTRKEAYLKGVGTGLSKDPSLFSTARHDGAVAPERGDPSTLTWYTQSIPAPVGYQAALASHLPHLAVARVGLSTLLGNLRAATRPASRLGMKDAGRQMPGTNPEWRVTYRARDRFAPADDGCRFGTVEGTS